jgi:hypothetical protein
LKAGLYSASLTAFLVVSYPLLQVDPTSQTQALTQQSIFLLTQIAAHIGANGTGLIAQVRPSQPPAFSPPNSAIRINICWFLSLVLSLTAVLFATIVQEWVRDYMKTFQRYSSPLKRARIRQYLFEGADLQKMSFIVDLIPALIHLSLFLFFAGLSDFLFTIHTAVAAATSAVILTCVLLYSWTLIAPAVDAQSPYQSPLSGAFWFLFQSVRRTQYRDKSTGGKLRPVSTNMADGRVQIAMNETDERRERDAHAIRWVVENLTEDIELEPFIVGIPGSLSTTWGKRVWEAVAREDRAESERGTLAVTTIDTVSDLGERITRLLRTCANPGILDPRVRKQRARACVDAALALTLNTGRSWQWFSEADRAVTAQTLRYLADLPVDSPIDRVLGPAWQEPPAPLTDPNFRSRWICMSILTVRELLQQKTIRDAAQQVVQQMVVAPGNVDAEQDRAAHNTAENLNVLSRKAWSRAKALRQALQTPDATPRGVFDTAQQCISDLNECRYLVGSAQPIDDALHHLLDRLKATMNDIPNAVLKQANAQHLMPQYIPPHQFIGRLAYPAERLRELHQAHWVDVPSDLGDIYPSELNEPALCRLMDAPTIGSTTDRHASARRPFSEQLWRLQDLSHNGMLYILELLFAVVRSLDQQVAVQNLEARGFYTGTFRAITSRWKEVRETSATQNGIVTVLREVLETPQTKLGMAASSSPTPALPSYLMEEMLKLVANVLRGKQGNHVEEAVYMIKTYSGKLARDDPMKPRAEDAILKLQPPKVVVVLK